MSRMMILRHNSLDQLQVNVFANQKRYIENASWLNAYFSRSNWHIESNISSPSKIQLLIPRSKTDLFDLDNTRIVYSALRHLTPVQASDARLWAYATHVSHWEYMRKRWPIEQYVGRPRLKEIIQERYFFMSDRSRALVRNGLARLWWYGYCSYDETRKDPFELTAVLLKNLDVTQSIVERGFSRNHKVTRAVLSVLLDRENEGRPFYVRSEIRELAKYLVYIGGVTIIDALEHTEIRTLVSHKIDLISKATAA